ncbi:hypothetical protein FA95DRAFT_1579727 [Auriscalpium vulgare]|uniref:Uncharacterized protein n=1 Tax=Auriscalpium vulgare TaxID=40419 RepID=A0ACB8S8V8_9AGAM|nr:hypothetical protein FA95DRAFT_1579727 [Auriscalpium vulgare]
MDEYADLGFVDSFGEGLVDAERALFGRERKARDRIHWQFPHDKDPRVRSALEWMQSMSHGLGAFGLDKFLQTRERGALFVNAAYEPPHGSNEPAFDWLTYDSAKETRDRIIQESVGFYDPAKQVVVFVLLPSKTGNSVAMWRRKIPVPNSVRLAHLHEIQLAKAALRKEYPVWVDELTPPKPPSVPPKPAKKKRGFFSRLFHVFKIEW